MKGGAGVWLAFTAFVYTALVGPTFLVASAPNVLIIAGSDGERRIALPAGARIIDCEGPRGTTSIMVDGARVRVTASPCPNKTCIKRGWLAARGDTAICIPNRVALHLE